MLSRVSRERSLSATGDNADGDAEGERDDVTAAGEDDSEMWRA